MAEAAIALGSNLPSSFGTLDDNLHEALRRLAALGQVKAVSSFRETDPVGYVDQPQFLNGAALLETELAPLELLRELLAIERAMGRVRGGVPAKGPRVIDLDLLLYVSLGVSVVLATEELALPHPEMARRRFVLEPLAEIAPAWRHPLLRVSVREMLTACTEAVTQ